MHAQAAAPTLLEDWQARRHRLLNLPEPGGQLVALHVQVLEYLITRYEDAPEAARPARYPLEPSLYVNDRAILVHHHVWEGKVGGVKTQREAQDRVSSLVSRIVSPGEEDTSAERPQWLDDKERPSPDSRTLGRWQDIKMALRWRGGVVRAIEAALAASPYLPRSALEYLFQRLVDPGCREVRVARALIQCENRSAPWYAVNAWRERIAAGCRDMVTRKLEGLLCRPENRQRALEQVHVCLADPNARVRLAAVAGIGRLGTLDDLGLLSDLLALPPQPDEHPREREALVQAMQEISQAE